MWKYREVWSLPVRIGRPAWHFPAFIDVSLMRERKSQHVPPAHKTRVAGVEIVTQTRASSRRNDFYRFPVVIAAKSHPIPSRTRKLSSPAPMVLQGRPCGRVGRRRIFLGDPRQQCRGFRLFMPWALVPSPVGRRTSSRPRSTSIGAPSDADSGTDSGTDSDAGLQSSAKRT